MNLLENYFNRLVYFNVLKLKELAVSQRQAHDDLVNSGFLRLTGSALPKC